MSQLKRAQSGGEATPPQTGPLAPAAATRGRTQKARPVRVEVIPEPLVSPAAAGGRMRRGLPLRTRLEMESEPQDTQSQSLTPRKKPAGRIPKVNAVKSPRPKKPRPVNAKPSASAQALEVEPPLGETSSGSEQEQEQGGLSAAASAGASLGKAKLKGWKPPKKGDALTPHIGIYHDTTGG